MDIKETICAAASPPGYGGISIVRMSGERSVLIADEIFRSSSGLLLSQASTHTIHHGYLICPASQERLDEALVTVLRAPKSYTREDTIEFGLHGAPLIVRRVLDVLIQKGARPANPGEFTLRAYLNGRLDLTQAEAVMEMIVARTEEGRQTAMAQLQGGLSKVIRPLYQDVVSLLAHVEASIDFTEEGIRFYSNDEIVMELERLLSRFSSLLETYKSGRIRRDGVNAVIVGRPNVGKSSLLNALLGEERAIVTAFPGTTRDILQEHLPLDGITLRLADMAGLGPTQDPIEQEGVRRAEEALEYADLALLVLDRSVSLQEEDKRLAEKLPDKNVLIILNKSDLSDNLPIEAVHAVFPDYPILSLSALTGTGISELKETIRGMLAQETALIDGGLLIQARHANAIENGRAGLARAVEMARTGASREFLASDLQIARKSLGELLGEEVSDEVIEAIFKQFCIGK